MHKEMTYLKILSSEAYLQEQLLLNQIVGEGLKH